MKKIRRPVANKYMTEGLRRSIEKSKKKGKDYKPEAFYKKQFSKIGKGKPKKVKNEIEYISKRVWRK